MKRIMILLLVLAMVLSMTACGSSDSDEEAGGVDYKIGIITNTATQSSEELAAAAKMKEKYGNMIVTATYPDQFSTKPQLVTETITDMAEDPAVKAIIICEAVNGTVAAVNQIRQTREDILFIGGIPAEAPADVADALDIVMLYDEVQLGFDIIGQAAKQGAKTFVHISFARHLDIATIAQRQENFKQRCADLGIEYVEAEAPDPTGEQGIVDAQNWIDENIKLLVDQYGKDTAFFATNCSMQVPLIRQCAVLGAIYPLQCCPSPYHAYPEAFDISEEGHEGDVQYMLDQIKAKVEEYGNAGRMSTWAVPFSMMVIEGSVEYAIKWCKGEITERLDEQTLLMQLKKIGGEEITWSNYVDTDRGELKNFKMIIAPFYDF